MISNVEIARRGTQWSAWIGACTASVVLHAATLVVLGLMLIAVPISSQVPSILAQPHDNSDDSSLDELRLPATEAPSTTDHLPVIENVTVDMNAAVLENAPLAPADAADGRSGANSGILDAPEADLPSLNRKVDKLLGKSAMFYGIEAEGNEFVFVVDMSGSMEGSRFRRARNELRRSIESLWPYQRYFIFFFSDDAYPMPAEGLLARTEKNVQATVRWLNQVQCDGPTNPLPALLQAIDMKPDAVFLLSNGKFAMEIVIEVAQYRTGDAVPIHTISFASREGEPMLKAIAKATGGTYRYVK